MNKTIIITEEYLCKEIKQWLISLAEEVKQGKANIEAAQKIVNNDPE